MHSKFAQQDGFLKAVEACRRQLSQADQAYLNSVESEEDLTRKLRSEIDKYEEYQSLRSKLNLILETMFNFVVVIGALLNFSLKQLAVLWGLLSLVLYEARKTKFLLPDVVTMVKDLCNDLVWFSICKDTIAENPDVFTDLPDLFVKLITFYVETIRFLQRHRSVSGTSEEWKHVLTSMKEVSSEVRKKVEQLKAFNQSIPSKHHTRPGDLLQHLDNSSTIAGSSAGSSYVSATNQVIHIPFPRNPQFFGREKDLEQVRKKLEDPMGHKSFRSCAIVGTGGIGKTQIALAYAYEQMDRGTPYVLWINCETGLSIAKSFYDIAFKLELDGFVDHDGSITNTFLVLRWLQKTTADWVMIIDNVENELIDSVWPTANHGRVLLTLRNHRIAMGLVDSTMEVEFFDREYGARYLKHIGRPNYSDKEVQAARQLSQRLGGLALPLTVMATQIRRKNKAIVEFLAFYERYSERLNKERSGTEHFYQLSLSTCWRTAFEGLTDDEKRILGVIACVAPDAIPEALFAPKDTSQLPVSLHHCLNDWELEEVKGELTDSSLVKADFETKDLSVHRLIQEEFRNFIDSDQKRESFHNASSLLCVAFPKLITGLSMRNDWVDCKRYIQHVLMLCRRYNEWKFPAQTAGEFDAFLELSTSCGWFLMESGAWSEEIELMDVAMHLCEDKAGLVYANLANSLGCCEYERGHVETSREHIQRSLDIRLDRLPPDDMEVGNSYNNYANLILQELKPGACEKSIDYYMKAIAIFEKQPEWTKNRIMHIPHTNLARAKRLLKQYDEAIFHAEQSRANALKFLKPENHFDGLSDYLIGNVLYDQGKYDEAEQKWNRALNLFRKENPTHPVTSSARMKLCCIDMRRGRIDKAIEELNAILVIAKLNEPAKGDKGEVARMQRKLAEAYELKGEHDTANALKTEAEAWRKEIQGDRFNLLPDTDLSYSMMNFHAFW